MSVPAPAVRGVIHDLGYKRYAGGRLAQSTRWRVIMRSQLSHAWKTWWRYKAWLGISVLITVVIAAMMYAAQTEQVASLTRNGLIARRIDQLSLGSIEYYVKVGFLLSLTCGASVIATDLRSGAFTFYFSRPVRPIDYLLGKLAGLFVLNLIVIALPMLVLVFVRLGLSHDADELLANLKLVPKIAVIGLLAAAVFASTSLAFSSLFAKPSLAIGVWAGYYLIFLTIVLLIGLTSQANAIASLDIGFALQIMAHRLFDFGLANTPQDVLVLPSFGETLFGIGFSIVAGIGVAYWRIRSVAHAGIGAS